MRNDEIELDGEFVATANELAEWDIESFTGDYGGMAFSQFNGCVVSRSGSELGEVGCYAESTVQTIDGCFVYSSSSLDSWACPTRPITYSLLEDEAGFLHQMAIVASFIMSSKLGIYTIQ